MRIAIVGAGGGVGSSVAFNLLLRAEPFEILLADGRSRMTVSHEMDLQQVIAAGATGSVRSAGLAEIRDADVVVACASAPLTVNRSRLVYARDNAAILASIADVLAEPPRWPGVLLVVTNPVDVLCTRLVHGHGLDPRRVLGYTANDSLRLRTAVGDLLGVGSATVDAWVLGEHGDGCVPLLDRVAVAGSPVRLDAEQRRAAAAFVRGWYVRHVALDSGRSSTWATGHGVARMVAAMARAGRGDRDGARGGDRDGAGGEPWPASVVLGGEYGIDAVALGVPVSLGAHGVRAVHEWRLAPDELAALRRAARGVAAAAEAVAAAQGPSAAGRAPR